MDLSSVRTGLKTTLENISGLRTYDYVPDNVNVPAAIVEFPSEVLFDRSFQRGVESLEISVLIIVGKANDRNSQAQIEKYLAKDGPTSIKATLDADTTLDGSVQTSRATKASGFGEYTVGTSSYLGFRVFVEVHG